MRQPMKSVTLPMVKCNESDVLTEACLDDIARQINEQFSKNDPVMVLKDFHSDEAIGKVTEATVIKEEAFWIQLQMNLFPEVVDRLEGWKAEGLEALIHFSGTLIKFRDRTIEEVRVRIIDRLQIHCFSIYPAIEAKPKRGIEGAESMDQCDRESRQL